MRFSTSLCCSLACLQLGSLAASEELYRIVGEEGSQLGFDLRAAGDVNNDGIEDFICGRPFWQVQLGGTLEAGAQVFSGADGALLLNVSTNEGRGAGFSVDGLGDLDGDGHDDVIVGSPIDNTGGGTRGAARVYSGIDGSLMFEFFGTPGSYFGHRVAGLGDVNGDGIGDVAIGAYFDSSLGTNRGSLTVFSGADGSLLHHIDGDQDEDAFGRLVAVGDLNNDGRGDFLAGSLFSNAHGPSFGFMRLYSGADASILHEFAGTESFAAFGTSMASVGDVNGDGSVDIAIGSGQAGPGSRGKLRVYSGNDYSLLFTVQGDTHDDRLGWSVSGAGDVNGDGFDDVLVGGVSASYVANWSGIARVFSGADGTELLQYHGEGNFDMIGLSVCSIGDTNGDGLPEFIVAGNSSEGDEDWTGVVRVISPVLAPPSSACFADLSEFGCPCGNNDASAGCANSTGSGALLAGTGSQSVAANSFVLDSSGLVPGQFALLFRGTSEVSVSFGDGRRCIGGNLQRIVVFQADPSGNSSMNVGSGFALEPVAGTTDRLQLWSRDPAGPCGSGFNLSNSLNVPWQL